MTALVVISEKPRKRMIAKTNLDMWGFHSVVVNNIVIEETLVLCVVVGIVAKGKTESIASLGIGFVELKIVSVARPWRGVHSQSTLLRLLWPALSAR